MAGIERIEILGTSNYLKERKQIGDDAIPDLNSIYRNILPLADDDIITECTKDEAKNPLLAYSDKALYDSVKNESAFIYYKNRTSITICKTTVLS